MKANIAAFVNSANELVKVEARLVLYTVQNVSQLRLWRKTCQVLTFSMSPAPRLLIAVCFFSGRSGVNFNLFDFNRYKGTVTITCRRKQRWTHIHWFDCVSYNCTMPPPFICASYSHKPIYANVAAGSPVFLSSHHFGHMIFLYVVTSCKEDARVRVADLANSLEVMTLSRLFYCSF